VDWKVWREEGEGLELSENQGWADYNRGLRCAEYAEGIYSGAGGGKKGEVDGDKILGGLSRRF
jgi:hypothetical protein